MVKPTAGSSGNYELCWQIVQFQLHNTYGTVAVVKSCACF